ncbi:MAG TPA: hypothetical protein VJY62_07535, partial [Bacteroidia bacterium]|nr:hypothetical protein [Bacteroidia bacterium]
MKIYTHVLKFVSIVIGITISQSLPAQNVGIGTSAPLDKLHVVGSVRSSSLAGVGNRNVLTDPNGTLIVGTNTNAPDWTVIGNVGTTAATNFIGTADAMDFVIKSGGSAAANERMRVLIGGQVVHNATTIQAGDVFSVYGTGYAAPAPIGAIGNWAINGYVNSTTGAGVYGENASGLGVLGLSASANGFGMQAFNANATGTGIIASGNNLPGLYIATAGMGGSFRGTRYGVMGLSAVNSAAVAGSAIWGINNKNILISYFGGSGVTGIDSSLVGPGGVTGASFAVSGNGVYGECTNTDGTGVFGYANNGIFQYGVWGVAAATVGLGTNSMGVVGQNQTNAAGSSGVLGIETAGGPAGKYAVFANGDMGASGAKPFMIDHPLDPANKMLRHFAIESPEILNMYRGNAVLDVNGEAVVLLPDYFESINNNNYSYNLTPVGQQMNVYIKTEIQNKQFVIAGGTAGAKVSWTVMSERNDPYLQQNPQKRDVVILKTGGMQGKYLTPELYGQSNEQKAFGGKLPR